MNFYWQFHQFHFSEEKKNVLGLCFKQTKTPLLYCFSFVPMLKNWNLDFILSKWDIFIISLKICLYLANEAALKKRNLLHKTKNFLEVKRMQ